MCGYFNVMIYEQVISWSLKTISVNVETFWWHLYFSAGLKLAHKFASTKSVQEEMKLKFNSEVKFKFLSITLLF